MKNPLHLGQMLSVHARLSPDRPGARDLERTVTFVQWNRRSCRLANGLLGLGLAKGDRVAIFAYNCVEWAEIYAATAKAGLVAVPINFRLVGREVQFIIENAEASAVIVQDELAGVIGEIRMDLPVRAENFIHFGTSRCPAGYRDYESLIGAARDSEPDQQVLLSDPSALMYTSGTTGHPKGAIRTHHGATMLSLIGDIEFGFTRDDGGLLVMPMCHANSLYCFGAFAYCGAVTTIYSRKSFDPEHCVRTLAETGSTFTSLVPTHYVMMLGLPVALRSQLNLDKITKLLISSAPARPDTKRAVMEMFPHSGLFEFYGATETGWVTMLHPHEQFAKLGSVGRECIGSEPIRLLDESGREVADGETGELYSNTPYTFDGYWKLPAKTREAFHGEYCTVGDMARRDADGFIQLVDRKSNMIISGGENVYPSEVEALVGAHPLVREIAVIGLPDEKWGERVHAVVVPHEGAALTEADLAAWSKERVAGYKRPRSYAFVTEEELPRNGLGKLLYRELKAKFLQQAGGAA
jgi:acyl-CoA synthetase (AMP-forming)/AMP-acid ligase II